MTAHDYRITSLQEPEVQYTEDDLVPFKVCAIEYFYFFMLNIKITTPIKSAIGPVINPLNISGQCCILEIIPIKKSIMPEAIQTNEIILKIFIAQNLH